MYYESKCPLSAQSSSKRIEIITLTVALISAKCCQKRTLGGSMHWKKLLWDNITSRHTLWDVCMHVCKSHRTPKWGAGFFSAFKCITMVCRYAHKMLFGQDGCMFIYRHYLTSWSFYSIDCSYLLSLPGGCCDCLWWQLIFWAVWPISVPLRQWLSNILFIYFNLWRAIILQCGSSLHGYQAAILP